MITRHCPNKSVKLYLYRRYSAGLTGSEMTFTPFRCRVAVVEMGSYFLMTLKELRNSLKSYLPCTSIGTCMKVKPYMKL